MKFNGFDNEIEAAIAFAETENIEGKYQYYFKARSVATQLADEHNAAGSNEYICCYLYLMEYALTHSKRISCTCHPGDLEMIEFNILNTLSERQLNFKHVYAYKHQYISNLDLTDEFERRIEEGLFIKF